MPHPILTLMISIIGIIIIPMFGLVIRLIIKWTKLEEQSARMTQEITDMHAELLAVIKEDRDNTNLRLRWLEEHLWRYGIRPPDSGSRPLPECYQNVTRNLDAKSTRLLSCLCKHNPIGERSHQCQK
jgi:hypothetical protein